MSTLTLDDYKAANVMGYNTRTYDASKAWDDYIDFNPNIHDLATRIAPDLGKRHNKPIGGLHMESYGGLEGRDFEANPEWGIDIKRQDYGGVLEHWRESVDKSGTGRSDILDWGSGGDDHQRAFNKALIEQRVDYDWYNQNQQYKDLATKVSELAAKPGLFGQDWSDFENIQQIRYLNELIGEGTEPTAGEWSWDDINKFEQMIAAEEAAEYQESIQPELIDVSDSPGAVPGLDDDDDKSLDWDGSLDIQEGDESEGQQFSEQAIAGVTPEQMAQIQAAIDAQRVQYEDMLSEFKETSDKEKQGLLDSFDKQMEAYKKEQILENKLKEAQTQIKYTDWWNEQKDTLEDKYEGLLSQATTDHQAALLKQQKAFEQAELDQDAAWTSKLQKLSKEADVYDTRITELKGELGIQEGLYDTLSKDYSDFQIKSAQEQTDFQKQIGGLQYDLGSLESDYSGLQSDYSGLQSDFGGLESDYSELQSDFGGLQSEFGDAKADWANQAGDFRAEIGGLAGKVGGLETTLGDYTRKNKELEAAVKRNEELAIQNAERARVSASYGSQGKPMNQQVQGVRTLNELTPAGTFGGGATGSFNRKGLRIKNLNI